MSKKKKFVVKKRDKSLLKKIKKPAFLRFLGYIADTQGCGTIRCIYPYLLLNHIMTKELRVNTTYMANFIPQPDFYKEFTLVQFQRSATEQHHQMFQHFKKNISPVAKVPLIYEIDDLLIDIPEWNYAHEYYKKNEDYVKKIIALSDGVVTSTIPLAEIYSEFNKNILVILNHLPKFIWGDIFPAHEYYEGGKIKILWAGSANHFSVKHLAEKGIKGGDFGDTLMNFIRKTTDKYEWTFMGAMPMELDSIKNKINFVKWVDVFNYPRTMKSLEADIGIAPLVDGVFNKSKCITRDSLVPTDNGIKFIDEIRVGEKIGERVISNTIEYKNQKTIRLKTKWGFEQEGTLNHRIKDEVNDWKQLDQFKIGDRVKLSSFIIHNEKIQRFTNFDNNDIIDVNIAWGSLLGYIFAGGYCYLNKTLSMTSKDSSFVIPLTKLLEDMDFEHEINSGVEDHIVKFTCHGLPETLYNTMNLNTGVVDKMFVQVPLIIFDSPKFIIREFIKSVFEINGDVEDEAYFIIKSNIFARQIQFLLLGFRVLSEIRKEGNNYKVIIKNTKYFHNFVGFNSESKMKKLYVIGNNHDNEYEYEFNWIDEVTEIVNNNEDVYDIEVEGHQYNSNGFISHNSNIKQLEFTASGMPGVYSDVYPYKTTSLRCKSDEEMISNIEKLASDIDFRAKIYKKDRMVVKNQLWWEENNNLKKYLDSYLSLFGKRL